MGALAILLASAAISTGSPVHWSPGHHHGWAVDPSVSVGSHGQVRTKWRCAPRWLRRKIVDNAAVCETFDSGKHWRMAFANYDSGNSDTGTYFNYIYTFFRTSSRDAVVSGGNGGHLDLWTNTNGRLWNETEAFDPTHDGGCVSWPDYCGGVPAFARITAATAPIFGGKPGGLVFRIGIPRPTGPGTWTYDPALFLVVNWPVRGIDDPHSVRIF